MAGGFKIPNEETQEKKISEYVKDDNNFIEFNELQSTKAIELESLSDNSDESKVKSNVLLYIFIFLIVGISTIFHFVVIGKISANTRDINTLKSQLDKNMIKATQKIVPIKPISVSSKSIKEIGINILIPSNLSDLDYSVTQSILFTGIPITSIGLSSKAINKIDTKCLVNNNSNNAPLGSIAKVAGVYGASAFQYHTQLILQEKDYYIAYLPSNLSCPNGDIALKSINLYKYYLNLNPLTVTLIK